METDCPFCRRVKRGEFDEGNQYAVTFEPLNPVVPGHRLFVPRQHVDDALEIPRITAHVMAFAAAWASGRDVGACNFITSRRAVATQSVPHLHIHLVPRREGDGLALPWTGRATSLGARED